MWSEDNDGYLNPGFPIGSHDEDDYDTLGYRSSLVELPPAEIFSGIFLEVPKATY